MSPSLTPAFRVELADERLVEEAVGDPRRVRQEIVDRDRLLGSDHFVALVVARLHDEDLRLRKLGDVLQETGSSRRTLPSSTSSMTPRW